MTCTIATLRDMTCIRSWLTEMLVPPSATAFWLSFDWKPFRGQIDRQTEKEGRTNVTTTYGTFRRTLLRYVRLTTWAVRLSSVCRLSCATLLHFTQMVFFDQYLALLRKRYKIQDTMKDEYELGCALSNGAISNDLEWPLN